MPAHPGKTHAERRRRAHELDEEATSSNPDETTRREVLEQELLDEGLSEEGEEIGDQIP